MASPHAILGAQALDQLAQIVKTDGRIGDAAEKQPQCLLSSHSHMLRPNQKQQGGDPKRIPSLARQAQPLSNRLQSLCLALRYAQQKGRAAIARGPRLAAAQAGIHLAASQFEAAFVPPAGEA